MASSKLTEDNNSMVLSYIQKQLDLTASFHVGYESDRSPLSTPNYNQIEPLNGNRPIRLAVVNPQLTKGRKKRNLRNQRTRRTTTHLKNSNMETVQKQPRSTRPRLKHQSTFVPKFESVVPSALNSSPLGPPNPMENSFFNSPANGNETSDTAFQLQSSGRRMSRGRHFEVIWHNLVYYHPKGGRKEAKPRPDQRGLVPAPRPTLNNISGSITSGQMTAIMGPSGAGKTVFLNCLTGHLSISGHKNRNSGVILINGASQVRVGFVEQYDNLLPLLTVRETLVFASRIKNAARFYLNHQKLVDEVIQRLDLRDCAGIRAVRCSNGQRKRLSIAIEMCFNSDILILDEPTTGMDAVTGFQIMRTLKALIARRKAISVLATVHQPSPKLFALFDNLIVLSRQGTIMFQGAPATIPAALAVVGLHCPMYTNISDFVLEIASGDFGFRKVQSLANHCREQNRHHALEEERSEVEIVSLQEAVRRVDQFNNRSFLLCTWLLFVRTLLCNFRNPYNSLMRFGSLLFVSLFLGSLFTDVVGEVSTCPPTKYFMWRFDLNTILEEAERQQLRVRENLSVIFMLVQVALFNSLLIAVVTIGEEVQVFRREHFNKSYSILAYYIAKLAGDIPFTFPTTAMFVVAGYYFTGQVMDQPIRVYMCVATCCVITFIGQLMGMTIGMIFAQNTVASVYSVIVILIPLFLFSGFFRASTDLYWWLAQLSKISFFRQALNSMLIAIYGLGRCRYENDLYRRDFHARLLATNQSEAEARPKWINSMVTLVTVQSEMSESDQASETTKLLADPNVDAEDKLIRYMGMSFAGANLNHTDRPLVLQIFKLNDDVDAYVHEFTVLLVYVAVLAVTLYVVMFVKFARKT